MMFYGFNGGGLGAYVGDGTCVRMTLSIDGTQNECLDANDNVVGTTPTGASPYASSGGSSSSSSGGSTSSTVGTGVGAGVGALLNRLLMPGATACPVGFIASGTTCIPAAAQPAWYTTPIGMGALLVGAIVAYKVIAG